MIKKIQNLYINLILLLLLSCSQTIEILPGLCYHDSKSSHLCLETPSVRDMEQLEPLYQQCEELTSSQIWLDCIMNEQTRQELLRTAV